MSRVEAELEQNINRIEEFEQCLFDLSGEIAGKATCSTECPRPFH